MTHTKRDFIDAWAPLAIGVRERLSSGHCADTSEHRAKKLPKLILVKLQEVFQSSDIITREAGE